LKDVLTVLEGERRTGATAVLKIFEEAVRSVDKS